MAPKSNNGDRGFSARELRALLWLLPVLAVVSWLVWEISRPVGGEAERGEQTPEIADTVRIVASAVTPSKTLETAPPKPQLFYFDPNTVEYHDLVRLGFTRGEALGIVKYRERGKVFEIPEDFAACYQVSEETYRRLAPYIRIGEKYRLEPFQRSDGRQSAPQHTGSAPRIPAPPSGGDPEPMAVNDILIDLNAADSAMLRSVRGIGEVTVGRIIEYRARLGGFVRVEQLAEVRGVTEQNYELMIAQIYVDPAVIQKIDINFAPAKTLASHPYMRAEALRKLLKQRQLKGGWRTPEELENDDIFTAEELVRLGPYLIFN